METFLSNVKLSSKNPFGTTLYLYNFIRGLFYFKKLIVIGDRVLIRLSKPNERTDSGLYLPPGVQEKEKVQQGCIIKTGPGYAIPIPVDDEPWKNEDDNVKYIPLQAKEGDIAIFLLSGATEVIYEGDKYFIVPQSAILMLEREEEL